MFFFCKIHMIFFLSLLWGFMEKKKETTSTHCVYFLEITKATNQKNKMPWVCVPQNLLFNFDKYANDTAFFSAFFREICKMSPTQKERRKRMILKCD